MALRGAAVAMLALCTLAVSPVARAATTPSPPPSSSTGTQDGVSSTSSPATVSPVLSPLVATAPGGVAVNLTGTGFPAKGACVLGVELAPGNVRTSRCTVQPDGSVAAPFVVPLDAVIGTHPIRVCVGDCGDSSVATDAVLGQAAVLRHATLVLPPPTLQAAHPSQRRPGRVVSLLGSGWSPGGTCTVLLRGVDTAARCLVDAAGGLKASFAVPARVSAGRTRIVVINRLPGGLHPAPANPVQTQSVPFRVLLVTVAASGTPTASTAAGHAAGSGGSLVVPVTVALVVLALLLLTLLAMRAMRHRSPRAPLSARVTASTHAEPWQSTFRPPAPGLRHVVRIETVDTGESDVRLEKQP